MRDNVASSLSRNLLKYSEANIWHDSRFPRVMILVSRRICPLWDVGMGRMPMGA